MRETRPHFLCVALVMAACGGASDRPIEGPSPAPETARDPAREPGLAAPNEPPELQIPAWTRVGVGQEIAFGLEVIDQESDEIQVELVGKPSSARFDPYTLTVVWKPEERDRPAGEFAVRITEKQREGGATRVFEHRFAIEVGAERQPSPVAQPLGPVVETLLTIHDKERLSVVNREWPLDRMLVRAAELARLELPKEKQDGVKVPGGAALYRSFLKSFAKTHDNPIIDPDAEQFDRAAFGDPSAWRIIAVRPRLDKRLQELRIVYQAPAHPDTYAMFKFGPVHGEPSEKARRFNNREFSRMVFEAFFTEDGRLNPKLVTDRKAHARAVAGLVKAVLTFESDELPGAGATFHALPCEARLGGGSLRGPDGGYASGDGWAWHLLKMVAKDGEMHLVSVPIKGFATDVMPSEDRTRWLMKCAPRFDPKDPAHDPAYSVLCRESGHVDLPATGDGYQDSERAAKGAEIVSGKKEASNMYVEHKHVHSVARLPLRDPRRDVFEEKGMTCSQCHLRDFGVRDMYDRAAYDPRAGVPTRENKKQDTTFFVIVPTKRWQPFLVDFQRKQECKARDAFQEYLGVKTSLGCPLKVE